MTVVTMPDGVPVDFGDMPPDQIKALIQKKFPDFTGAAPPTSGRNAFLDVLGVLGGLTNPVSLAGQGENPAAGPLAQGLTFGTADEIGGVVGGIAETFKPRKAVDVLAEQLGTQPGGATAFERGYNKTVEKARSDLEKYRTEHPILSTGLEATGALMTLPLTSGLNVIRAPAAVRAGAPVATKVGNMLARGAASTGNAALTGAAYGAAYGAGTAEGGPGARLEGMLQGGGVGAALGVGGNALLGTAKGIGALAFGGPINALRKITGPRREAERQVVNAIRDDAAMTGQTPQQRLGGITQAQQRGVPMAPLDIGEASRGLADTASIISPQGRNILTNTLGQRFETQHERVIDTITRVAPGVNAPGAREILQQAARNANRPAYDRAYREGNRRIWGNDLEQLTVSPSLREAMRDASRIGADEAARRGTRPPQPPFEHHPDGSMTPVPGAPPTLEYWDQVKRALDGQVGTARRAGNDELVRRLTGLRSDLVGILDRAVPSYQQARQGAAAFFGADNALDAGAAFVKRPVDNEAARRAIAGMSPAERQLFGEGFATQLIDDIRNVSERHNVINRIFRSPASRERFEIALGPHATREMETTVRLEDVMDLGRVAVTGNSATARRQLAAQAVLGYGAGSAITGDPLDPKNLAFMLLTLGGGRIVSRADQQMGRHIAEMLTSNNPQAVQEALRRIGRSPRLTQQVRAGHGILTRLLTPAVGGGSVNPKRPNE